MSSVLNLTLRDLDKVALAALAALVSDNLEKSQVNKLIEVLEATQSVECLLAHIARQVGRGIWGRTHFSATILFNVLKGRGVDGARSVLGMFKWLYEAGTKRRGNLQALRRSLNLDLRGNQVPPQGFFYKYLEATLR